MPLPFFIVCELLEECHKLTLAHKGHARSVEAWFRRYRGHVDAYDTNAVALLSTLLPDKRTDRVYCIQAPRLEKIIGRGLGLGVSRIADLKRYREPGNACDLADCVERILNITVGSFAARPSRVARERTNMQSRCNFTPAHASLSRKSTKRSTAMLQL